MIKLWLSPTESIEWYNHFLAHLLSGNIQAFEKNLSQLMMETVSHHDVSINVEAFYHGLMIGFTASLYQDKNYELRSNRESGEGRYDYMILSLNSEKPTIILEFKRVPKIKDEKKTIQNLNQAAKKALAQIDKKGYVLEAKRRGSQKIIKIGLAFCGKLFSVVEKRS